jgi:predicted phage baseplate assembly protein
MSAEMDSGCPCPAPQDPQVISNPPGLPAISYRVGDFTGFRRALLRPRPGEQAISTWRPAPGDLGLQVLEWWAYLGDVLTFYNERYANESYLGTATQRASVANLVALLGYQPGPGIAAAGTLAAVSSPGPAGEGLSIPAGMSLTSTASPGVPSQTFEVDAAHTFTGPSQAPVTLPPETGFRRYADGTQSVLLAGRVSGVKAGDRLLLVDGGFTGGNDNWSLVTVTALTPMTDPGTGAINTQVAFRADGWGPTPHPATPPDEPSAVPGPRPPADSTGYRLMRPAAAAALFNAAALTYPLDPLSAAPSGEQAVVETGLSGPSGPDTLRVHLSAAVRAISPGDMVLFDGGAGKPSALALVTAAFEMLWAVPYPGSGTSAGSPPVMMAESRTPPPDIPIAHTVLDLTLALPDSYVLQDASMAGTGALASIAVRYGFKDVGTIIGVPAPELKSLGATASTSYAPPAAGHVAFLQDATGSGVPVNVVGAGPGRVTLAATGDPRSAIPAGKPLVVPLQLLLNLVSVSRGTTVTGEVLGSGNAALARQSFTLAKSPLTYLRSGSGSVSTLRVSVNDIEWNEVPSFYGQGPAARVFVVTRSPDQAVTTVTFGDGVNGARLPSGTGNVVASYRYGSGRASPPAGRLTTIRQPQLNLASVQNPVPVSGGKDPQPPDGVRTTAPASVSMLGRAISATDYESIAAQAPGVSRAAAYWTFDQAEQRTLVTVYVGDDPDAVASAYTALAGAWDPSRPVQVVAAAPVELSLSGRLVVAASQPGSAVITAAKAALSAPAGGLFSSGRMGIGQRLYRSAIDAALMVPGVTAVHELEVTTAEHVLGEVLDPGDGAYFALPPHKIQIKAVSANG